MSLFGAVAGTHKRAQERRQGGARKLMGLYLCVFRDDVTDEELEGVEVGGYDDFNRFRQAVADYLESAGWGSRFPVLMLHRDSQGVWTAAEAAQLEAELLTIGDELARVPAATFGAEWQKEIAKNLGLRPTSLLDTFIDVDGERLVERLLELARTAQREGREISFQ
jgi:hypothetical protein